MVQNLHVYLIHGTQLCKLKIIRYFMKDKYEPTAYNYKYGDILLGIFSNIFPFFA